MSRRGSVELMYSFPLQAIGLILHQSAIHNFKGPVLVLCPLSVTNNWEAEFQRSLNSTTPYN